MDKYKGPTKRKNKSTDFFREELRYNVTPMNMSTGQVNLLVTIDNEKFDKTYNTEEGFNS